MLHFMLLYIISNGTGYNVLNTMLNTIKNLFLFTCVWGVKLVKFGPGRQQQPVSHKYRPPLESGVEPGHL